MIVRALRPADRKALAGLFAALAADPDAAANFHPHPLDAATAARIVRHEGRDAYLGAFCDDKLRGYALVRGWDEGYEVPSFGAAVDPGSRDEGVGSALLSAARALCVERGANSLMLKVHPGNERALQWYLRAGFEIGGEAPDGQLVCRLTTL